MPLHKRSTSNALAVQLTLFASSAYNWQAKQYKFGHLAAA